MYAKVDVNKKNRIAERNGESQKRDTKERIPNSSRIPEALRDAPIGVVLICLDGHFEDCLGQHIQQAAAEQANELAVARRRCSTKTDPPTRSTR